VRSRLRLDLDPTRPPPATLARQHEDPIAEVEEPLRPDAELLPRMGDPPGVVSNPVVSPMRAREIEKHARAVPFDVLGLKAQDRLEVGVVDRLVQGFEGRDVLVHAR
jgi:hypothetical protein